MAIQELKKFYWETKDGATGHGDGKLQPVKVPRGSFAVAKKIMDTHSASKVALKFKDGNVLYYRKNGKMKKPDQMLAYLVSKHK